MPSPEIKKILKQYAASLKENKIFFKHMYLFGSYAKGNASKHSDIDVAIVTDDAGKGKKRLNKKMQISKLTIQIDPRIEPILLDEDEFKRGQTSIMADQVSKTGILIK